MPSKTTSKRRSRTSSSKPAVTRRPAAPRPAAPQPVITLTHEQIAKRAYEIWCGRGGQSEDNWFEAQRQLTEESQT